MEPGPEEHTALGVHREQVSKSHTPHHLPLLIRGIIERRSLLFMKDRSNVARTSGRPLRFPVLCRFLFRKGKRKSASCPRCQDVVKLIIEIADQ